MNMHEFAHCIGKAHRQGSFLEALDRLRKSPILALMSGSDVANPRGWQAWEGPPAPEPEPPKSPC